MAELVLSRREGWTCFDLSNLLFGRSRGDLWMVVVRTAYLSFIFRRLCCRSSINTYYLYTRQV